MVDSQGKLLGRITIDDIVDVLEEEATEDIQKMAGLTDEEELRETSVIRIVQGRFPWLVTALFGELIAAIVLSNNSATLEQVLSLAFFIPVIIAVGGNVGIQSSAIVVRGLATGEIDFGDLFRRLLKEFKIAMLNGLLLGAVMFMVVRFVWQEQTIIALLIASALLTVNLVAGLVGSTIPLILKQFKIDPALATGPFITTSNDIIGLFIYLKIATIVLGHS